jgi:hypothetical protein
MNDEWDSDSNPIEDINRAIAVSRVPHNYRAIAKTEAQIYDLTDRLTQAGLSPEEIATLYVRYGVWPTCP